MILILSIDIIWTVENTLGGPDPAYNLVGNFSL